MDSLPDEILLTIFENYLFYDQVLVCSLVCKRWLRIIKNFCKLKQLAILNSNYYAYPTKWFFTSNHIYNCQFQLITSKFNLIQLNLDKLLNLKYLFILHKSVETDFLNHFLNLENLAIRSSRFTSGKNSLNLDFLKILSIEESELINILVLNLPKLNKLKINLFKAYKCKLVFKHPESIELIECPRYLGFIKSFFNLKILYIERLVNSNLDLLLTRNKKLLEIHFSGDEETFHNLRKQKELLKMTKLKIYYLSTNLTNCDNLSNYNLTNFGIHIDESTIEFYVQNFNRLANIMPFVKFINYNCLENNFKRIPRNLINKFVNFYQLEVTSSIKDLDQFKIFLNDCEYINRIFINSSELNNEFFNYLPQCSPNLKCLEIKNKKNLNFQFLLKFKSLDAFFTDQNLPITLIKELFDKFKIKYFSFYLQSPLFLAEITFKDNCKFQLSIFPIKIDFNELDGLLNYLKSEDYKADLNNDMNYEEKMMSSLFFKA